MALFVKIIIASTKFIILPEKTKGMPLNKLAMVGYPGLEFIHSIASFRIFGCQRICLC